MLALVLAAGVLAADPVLDVPMTGKNLVTLCKVGRRGEEKTGRRNDAIAMCMMYVEGANDALELVQDAHRETRTRCLPVGGITADEGVNALIRWADSGADLNGLSGATAVALAMNQTYPCR